MGKSFSDLMKDFVEVNWSAEMEKQAKVFNTPVIKPLIPDIDSDELPINRTAKSAEEVVEKLDAMMEAQRKASDEQRKRSNADRVIAVIGAVAALVAAAAALYPLIF